MTHYPKLLPVSNIFLYTEAHFTRMSRGRSLLYHLTVDLHSAPGLFPFPMFMRRLLTGYAVNFNLRHRRSGHLFQNRYKSILCQEDAYLLELVRCIHCNPCVQRWYLISVSLIATGFAAIAC